MIRKFRLKVVKVSKVVKDSQVVKVVSKVVKDSQVVKVVKLVKQQKKHSSKA